MRFFYYMLGSILGYGVSRMIFPVLPPSPFGPKLTSFLFGLGLGVLGYVLHLTVSERLHDGREEVFYGLLCAVFVMGLDTVNRPQTLAAALLGIGGLLLGWLIVMTGQFRRDLTG